MSDAEWAVVREAMPVPAWMNGKGGQPEGYCHRQMLDAMRYPVAGGSGPGQLLRLARCGPRGGEQEGVQATGSGGGQDFEPAVAVGRAVRGWTGSTAQLGLCSTQRVRR